MPLSKEVENILEKGSATQKRALFNFNDETPNEEILKKYKIWVRYLYPKYFKSEDAPFHADIDRYNLKVYRGTIKSFTDIVHRDGAKTTRTKLFFAFCIANDTDHSRKYIKVLCKDLSNSKQIVTDIYNMLIRPRTVKLYPEIFKKTEYKREETMGSFTTATEVKITAGTVGTQQRGDIQEDARPDIIWFDDFETRLTLRSAVETNSIWDNMEEARTGLAKEGASVYTCNYISERGNVHKLVEKKNDRNIVMIVPIERDGKPTWPARFTMSDIRQIEKDADDYGGEYLCDPVAAGDTYFNREAVDKMEKRQPMVTIAGFKIFRPFDPTSRYASGHDVSKGVGLDSSTSVFIDFTTRPAQVVATFNTDTLKPSPFGDEIKREANFFGQPLVACENNYPGNSTVDRLKQIYPLDKLYETQGKATKIDEPDPKDYGWNTNAATKGTMLEELEVAIRKGYLDLNDPDLIKEARSYTRDDLMDKEEDPRLTTRHFDLLIACAIAWQMKNHATSKTADRPITTVPRADSKQNIHSAV